MKGRGAVFPVACVGGHVSLPQVRSWPETLDRVGRKVRQQGFFWKEKQLEEEIDEIPSSLFE